MKTLLALLLLSPLFLPAQTVHRKGNKIVYEDEVLLPGRSATQIKDALQKALADLVKKGKKPANVHESNLTSTAIGDMKLNAIYPASRTVNYTLAATAKDGGYDYRIDSVYLIEKNGGESEKIKTAKQLFDDMEISGPVAETTEKILNEIDLNFQKLLALLKRKSGGRCRHNAIKRTKRNVGKYSVQL